jgi:hypothetical protein
MYRERDEELKLKEMVLSPHCDVSTSKDKALLNIGVDANKIPKRGRVSYQDTPGGRLVMAALESSNISEAAKNRVEGELLQKFLDNASGDIKICVELKNLSKSAQWEVVNSASNRTEITSINGHPSEEVREMQMALEGRSANPTKSLIRSIGAELKARDRLTRQNQVEKTLSEASRGAVRQLLGKELRALHEEKTFQINKQAFLNKEHQNHKAELDLSAFKRFPPARLLHWIKGRPIRKAIRENKKLGRTLERKEKSLAKEIKSKKIEDFRKQVLKQKLSPADKKIIERESKRALGKRIEKAIERETTPQVTSKKVVKLKKRTKQKGRSR